jgi:hypothetical protein
MGRMGGDVAARAAHFRHFTKSSPARCHAILAVDLTQAI